MSLCKITWPKFCIFIAICGCLTTVAIAVLVLSHKDFEAVVGPLSCTVTAIEPTPCCYDDDCIYGSQLTYYFSSNVSHCMDIYDLHSIDDEQDSSSLNDSNSTIDGDGDGDSIPFVQFTHSTACHPSSQSLSQSNPEWNIDDTVSFYVNQECTSWTEASIHSQNVQQNLIWIIVILSFVCCSVLTMLCGCIPMHSHFFTKYVFCHCCCCRTLCGALCCRCNKSRNREDSFNNDPSPRSYSSGDLDEDSPHKSLAPAPAGSGSRSRGFEEEEEEQRLPFTVTRSGTKSKSTKSKASKYSNRKRSEDQLRGISVHHQLHQQRGGGNDRKEITYRMEEDPDIKNENASNGMMGVSAGNGSKGNRRRFGTVSRSHNHRHSRLSTVSSNSEGRGSGGRRQAKRSKVDLGDEEEDSHDLVDIARAADRGDDELMQNDKFDENDHHNNNDSESENERDDKRHLMERKDSNRTRALSRGSRQRHKRRDERERERERDREQHHIVTINGVKPMDSVNTDDVERIMGDGARDHHDEEEEEEDGDSEPETEVTEITEPTDHRHQNKKGRNYNHHHMSHQSMDGGDTVITAATTAMTAETGITTTSMMDGRSHDVGSLGLSESRYFEDEWYEDSRMTASRRTTKTSTGIHAVIGSIGDDQNHGHRHQRYGTGTNNGNVFAEQERSRINRKVLMQQNASKPISFVNGSTRSYRKEDEFERIRRRFYM